MSRKLKLINQLVEILPQDDNSTYPRLNFKLRNGICAVPAGSENPDNGSIASSYKIRNTIYYIPKTIAKPLVLTDFNYRMIQVYPSTYTTMTTVPQLDTSNVTNMQYMFYACQSLSSIPQLNTSNVTNMYKMFYECTSLTSIPQLDTSNVMDMSFMFQFCTSLPTTFPWTIDCSSIASAYNMEDMFINSSVTEVTLANVKDNIKSQVTSRMLKGDNTLTINFVNISNYRIRTIYPSTYTSIASVDINTIKTQYPDILDNLTSTVNMFNDCNKLTTINNMSQLDTSNVTNMSMMFDNCTSLTTISQLDTNKVTNMGGMFQSCSSLTTIPQLDTRNVTNMRVMFSDCSSLTTVPEIDTSNVTDMNGMFSGCTSLTTVPELNTSNVTNMYGIFSGCTSLTSIPQLDTSNVTNMYYMFNSCTSLTTIPQLDTSKVTNISYMFSGCTSLPSTFPWSIDCSSISGSSSMQNMFKGSSVMSVTLKNVDVSSRKYVTSQLLKGDNTLTINFVYDIIDKIAYIYPDTYTTITSIDMNALKNQYNDLSNLTSCERMFYGCQALTTINNMDKIDTSNVTSMYGMFSDCSSLTTVPTLDTSNVTDMKSMFYDCENLTSIPELDTSNVTNMYGMFNWCTSLASIPQLNTSNVTNMYYMFSYCTKLKTVPQLDTSRVTDMRYMFSNCGSLPATFPWTIDCSSISNADNIRWMFSGSSVTNVTLANVNDNIKSQITSQWLKSNNTLTINFV